MIAPSLLALPDGADMRARYLIRLAVRWADRADRAGLRSDRLRHLGDAWSILACPGVDSARARLEVCRAIVSALTPFERAVLADAQTAGTWALELGYVEARDGGIEHTPLGAAIVHVAGVP